MRTRLLGREREVIIDTEGPFVVVGDRINPSGRMRLSESLSQGDLSLIREEALAQVAVGAQVIDVNVSVIGVDEEEVLPAAVEMVAEAVDTPISIDTASLRALERTLATCPGKPLVNSVTGEERSLQTVLPLVKEHRCAVIGMCMDEEGIPKTARQRLDIAQKILHRAEQQGIGREDVVIDPLATAVGADQTAALVTLEAIGLIYTNLGTNMILGASNISFGLPERGLMNRAFLAMAMAKGVGCALANPLDTEMRKIIATCDLLRGHDEYAERFLEHFRKGW